MGAGHPAPGRSAQAGRRGGHALPVPIEREAAGFALESVRQAGLEAGIDPQFIDAAWHESVAGVAPAKPSVDRRITRFLDGDERSLEATRVIAAPPEEVLETVHEVFTSTACNLALVDQVGGHPLEGGALLFKPPSMDGSTQIGKAVAWSDMRLFLVSFRAHGPGGPTEVRLRAPMEHSRKLNYRVGVGLSGVLSAGGFAGALAAGTGAALAAPLVGALGVGGFAATWFLSAKGYRWMYRHALQKGQTGLRDLLGQVAVHVETRSHRNPERRLPPSSAESSAAPEC